MRQIRMDTTARNGGNSASRTDEVGWMANQLYIQANVIEQDIMIILDEYD